MILKRKLRIASIFSGCGGMDLGTEGGFRFLNRTYAKLNTETVFAIDFEKSAVDIYNSNFERPCMLGDIRDIATKDIPSHDILTGGFPCQSFSVIAQNPPRLGFKDERGKLFLELCRILAEKKPKNFIFENVKGLLSANGGKTFPIILKEFEKAGYYVAYKVLNASEFGVPQRRERVFITGFRSKAAFVRFSFPKPSEKLIIPLKKVVYSESEVDSMYYFTDKALRGLQQTRMGKLMNKGRVQSLDGPCNTVGAHLAKVSINSTDPILCVNGKYRMFTPREVARIQSFPESFKLPGAKTSLYRALGNAVPPVMMWHVTREVIRAISNQISVKTEFSKAA